ncbi:MAG: DegQ family serine endoprotease [Alphaproteobacteria bacterium]
MRPEQHLRGLFLAHRLRTAALALTLALMASPAIFSLPVAAAGAPDSFADLAEKLLPSVVNISTTQVIKTQDRPDIPQAPPGSPFEDFFREFFDRNGPERSRRATSLGSGFIIGASGFVVTNNHVIADADEISVILHDNERFEATLIGRDPKTDLALLKIDAGRDLPAVDWGNSATARVGDWVVAIGNPFGLGGSVTAGIISARQRDINAGPYDNFIQTDASINRGNSGGPLFNLEGQVIGVNTAIFSPSGGSVGIGFSIPSSLAERVVDQLHDFGRTKRGWLGVRIQTVTDEIAESLGLDSARGALVASVTADGPAQAGKIEAGDVVLSFDSRPIDQMRELPRIVADTEIGREVDVEVWRRGAMVNLRVSVGELEEDTTVLASVDSGIVPEEPQTGTIDSLGLALATLNDELRLEHSVQEDADGVLVTSVEDGGPAAEKGLRQGDLIMEVSQEAVTTPAQVAANVALAQEAGRRSVLLLVNRNGELRFVAVRIDAG